MVVAYVTMLLLYSVICCCLIPFIGTGLMAYMLLVYVALMAYAYRSGVEKLGEPAEIPAPKPETPQASFDLPAGPEAMAEPSLSTVQRSNPYPPISRWHEPVETFEPIQPFEPMMPIEPAEPTIVADVKVEAVAEATLISTAVVETFDVPNSPNLPPKMPLLSQNL